MNNVGNTSPRQQAVINGLAIVGFIALLTGSLWLATYSARFVPKVADGFGSAAVYLGSLFTPGTPAKLATTTPLAATTASSTVATSTPTPATTTPVASKPTAPVTPTAGKKTTTTVKIGGTTEIPTLHGLPDLAVQITSVGYLATTSTASFMASTTVPAGARPAIKFVIKNDGTNVTGKWNFTVSIPTASGYLYTAPMQKSLAPGDRIDYTLGFDQALAGSNKKIIVTVNPDNSITETTTNNNTASATITILGS